MELFKNTNFDFLGKKWPFIIGSLVLTAAGFVSLGVKGGPAYGLDLNENGGVTMRVGLAEAPKLADLERMRSALSARIAGEISVVEVTGKRQVLITIGLQNRDEKTFQSARGLMVEALQSAVGQPGDKPDFNTADSQILANAVRAGAGLAEQQLQDAVKAWQRFRDTKRAGVLTSFDDLAQSDAPPSPAALRTLKQEVSLGKFAVLSSEVIGPKIGKELRQQAILTVLAALGGMLVYIAFRFEWIYGVAAVVAVFHDTLITIGLFSLLNKEITLTVVAALLTLVGYSMNDTIVVFDRIRENLKVLRREKLESLVNQSVNQTLSRTILTSGLTLLTALSLLVFGGPVLNGFSLALVIGIIIGTYSSIFIASPIVVFWQNYLERRKRRRFQPVAAQAAKETARRSSAKPVR